jgi:UDP-N-acetylmuramyl tripeptide synthase
LTHIALDHTGARFTISGRRLFSPLLGRGHLKNVALALTYAFAAGVTTEQARRVLRRLRPLHRRMEHCEVDGRLILDDTAGHSDSLQATFDVAAMLARSPRMRADGRIVVAYAIRGSRGAARRQTFDWFDTLEQAANAALAATEPGDLIVLVGAQGMNEGQRLLNSASAVRQTGSRCRS